ncbi:hypothetical protein AB0M02_22505 [Actinoplanes sp. NPDC051861]|uniref:hypothetical protein n=1 Tax=Actinoplanes sp. NPDC051861 TaxID=3155170 RepID=UPI00342793D4
MASLPRAVAMAALQAALSASWIAARELPPAKRRLARLAVVGAVAAAGYVASPDPEPGRDLADEFSLAGPSESGLPSSPSAASSPAASSPAGSSSAASPSGVSPSPAGPVVPSPSEFVIDKRKAAVGVAVLGLSVAAMAGRRQLEKRWLRRLTSKGHAHPTRALAVRMAAVEFTGQLAIQLADLRVARLRERQGS